MALRYENTDAPSEETSSVISRSLASFEDSQLLPTNRIDGSSSRMRDRMEDGRTSRPRGLAGEPLPQRARGPCPQPRRIFSWHRIAGLPS